MSTDTSRHAGFKQWTLRLPWQMKWVPNPELDLLAVLLVVDLPPKR